jgi:hypothetical protein
VVGVGTRVSGPADSGCAVRCSSVAWEGGKGGEGTYRATQQLKRCPRHAALLRTRREIRRALACNKLTNHTGDRALFRLPLTRFQNLASHKDNFVLMHKRLRMQLRECGEGFGWAPPCSRAEWTAAHCARITA